MCPFIKARIEDNTYIGSVVIYATHFDWFSESSLTMDDASKSLLQYRVLVELEGAESATIRNADGSEITAFNESKASSERGIYSLSAGDYIFDIVPEEGGDPVPMEVEVKDPVVGGETNKVTVEAADTAVAKVGDVEYKTLAEAIEAAKNGGTVELLRDVYVETWDQVWNTKGMTVDGNNKTITIGKVESNVNGNYLFYNAEDLKVNDLTIRFQTNGNGLNMVSGELNNVKMYGGANSNYAVFVCNGGANNAVTIESCTFKDFGIAVYSQPGTAATSNIKVTGSTITDCGIAICSYAQSNVFTGNTVTGSDELSFAGGADAVHHGRGAVAVLPAVDVADEAGAVEAAGAGGAVDVGATQIILGRHHDLGAGRAVAGLHSGQGNHLHIVGGNPTFLALVADLVPPIAIPSDRGAGAVGEGPEGGVIGAGAGTDIQRRTVAGIHLNIGLIL